MDPEANLKEQRELFKKINEAGPPLDGGDDKEYVEDLVSLAVLAEAMDNWLSRGGFLPTAWRREG